MIFNISKSNLKIRKMEIKCGIAGLMTGEHTPEVTELIDLGEHILKLIFEPIDKFIDDDLIETIGLTQQEHSKILEFIYKSDAIIDGSN